jgi:hypothetical protein
MVLADQSMAFHKLTQDHREKRHPHYYPENVVEVLEVRWRCLMWSPISCGHCEWCLAAQLIATHKLMYMRVAAQIEFYCDRGEGSSDETGRQAHGCEFQETEEHQYC